MLQIQKIGLDVAVAAFTWRIEGNESKKRVPAADWMRNFLRLIHSLEKPILSAAGTLSLLSFPSIRQVKAATSTSNPIFWIWSIPDDPFVDPRRPNRHKGIDALLHWMGMKGLKFYRSNLLTTTSGPWGMIEADDVVLIKVNAQWKYRGCTNSDLIRGLIQNSGSSRQV